LLQMPVKLQVMRYIAYEVMMVMQQCEVRVAKL